MQRLGEIGLIALPIGGEDFAHEGDALLVVDVEEDGVLNEAGRWSSAIARWSKAREVDYKDGTRTEYMS